MDIIDHLIFTANNPTRGVAPALTSDYIIPFMLPPITPVSINLNYTRAERENFILCQDPSIIERSIQKHWFDLVNGPLTFPNPVVAPPIFFDPAFPPPYHIIYAYLIENSRIAQIIQRLIYLYQHDELIGIAGPGVLTNQNAFQWINNTENLFFKELPNNSYRNITGHVRPNFEASRRNAYYRLFGMDLAFGESDSTTGLTYPYYKAKAANQQFIILFEQFLSEAWQAYINARNTSGANSTDYQRLIDLVGKIRQMLMSRRGANGTINLGMYRFMNLSKEEYSSFVMMSWFYFIISYDTSPLVTFLGCQANTASERLIKIGRKVGIEAHTKSQGLFDMAPAMNTILREIETGTLEMPNWLQRAIESQTPDGLLPLVTTPEQAAGLVDLLTIINNWEKATGHRIKNPEANVRGTVRVQQNGVKAQTEMN
jgi:hypothetical protein